MTIDVQAVAQKMLKGKAEDVVAEMAQFASQDKWGSIYQISSLAGREVSILIDADGEIFVDWGGPGLVPLSPPTGAKIPFRLWVHTHPFGNAYWSATDQRSLAGSPLILQHAWVLGQNGVLASSCITDATPSFERLGKNGPLSKWTAESVNPWPLWQNCLETCSPWISTRVKAPPLEVKS